jgi:hypothetical protein
MARRVYLRLSEIIPVASCGHCMTREGLSYWPVARGRPGARVEVGGHNTIWQRCRRAWVSADRCK